MSIVKKEVSKLLKKSNYQPSNLTSDEGLRLRYLSEDRNLTTKGADKGGKIVIMDMTGYIEHCELLLNGKEVRQKTDMLKNNYITKQ